MAPALDTGAHRRLEPSLQAIDPRAGFFLARVTTISAAADGVGARRSATKSAIVTSTSCPTAEITGTGEAAMARARISSLKAHRSSIDPAAPPDDDDVDAGDAGDRLERAGDVIAGAVALDAHRPHDQVRIRMPAAQDLDDVLERGAVERGDDADLARQGGNRALARGANRPSACSLRLQLLERELQRAAALRLEMLADELILAFRFVDRQPSARDDVKAVVDLEFQVAIAPSGTSPP